jgi:hypothetical protein
MRSRVRRRRRLQHPDVPEDDPRDALLARAVADLHVRDDVDPVADAERSGERLVHISGDLHGPQGAAKHAADPLHRCVGEARERDLLTGVDRLCCDERADLLRARDRPGDDALTKHLLLLEEALRRHVGAGRSFRNVACGDEHGDVLLRVLDRFLVVRDVEADEEGGQDGKPNRGEEIAGAVGHGQQSFLGQLTSWMARAP